MGIEGIIAVLIYAAVLAIVIYIVIWALQTIAGIALPERVIQLIWVIFVLLIVLWILQAMGGLGGFNLPGVRG